MKNNFTAPQHSHAAEEMRRENEAFREAIMTCDEDTYNAVTSILKEAGLLP